MLDWLKRADQWVANEAATRQAGYMQAANARNAERVLREPAADLAASIGSARQLDDAATAALQRRLAQATAYDELARQTGSVAANGRASLIDELVPQMNRGRFGERGFREALNEGIATNAYVRRGVLPASIVGGGALLTEGAQQLLALMGFMQQGAQTEERADNSYLA